MTDRQQLGKDAEKLAEKQLTRSGLSLIERNYLCRGGEIDLIMEHDGSLVFIEVRYRSHEAFGGPQESVTHRKQQRLILAANHYLQKYAIDKPCRFDVVSVKPGRRKPEIEWIQNAFQA